MESNSYKGIVLIFFFFNKDDYGLVINLQGREKTTPQTSRYSSGVHLWQARMIYQILILPRIYESLQL